MSIPRYNIPSRLGEVGRKLVHHEIVRRRKLDALHVPAQTASQRRMQLLEVGVALPHTPLEHLILFNFSTGQSQLAHNFIFHELSRGEIIYPGPPNHRQKLIFRLFSAKSATLALRPSFPDMDVKKLVYFKTPWSLTFVSYIPRIS